MDVGFKMKVCRQENVGVPWIICNFFVLVFLLCITDPALFYQTFKGYNWCGNSFYSVFAPGRAT